MNPRYVCFTNHERPCFIFLKRCRTLNQRAFDRCRTVLKLWVLLQKALLALAQLVRKSFCGESARPSPHIPLFVRIDIIQRPVDGQFTEHDDLSDSKHLIAMWAFEKVGEVTEHDAGAGQGFAGVAQQTFGVYVGGDHEHGAGFARGFGCFEGGEGIGY
ncbi:hypothetical protein EMIT0P294_11062 [Pseudomonas sp. IT-P294]